MMNNLVVISVINFPYKKMKGLLQSKKINPDFVAQSILASDNTFIPIKWQNYLTFSHKIKKIILLKENDLFLFVGYSIDDVTIVYNDEFSKGILKTGCNNNEKLSFSSSQKTTCIKKNKFVRLDILLDKIAKFGIDSLSKSELNELDYLSRQNLK